ncbi:MAG: hypothetical protein R6U27_13445 [Desulfobacterales bacterium]
MLDENKQYIRCQQGGLEFLVCEREDLPYRDVWAFAAPDKLDIMKQNRTPFFTRRTNETEFVVHRAIKTLMLNLVPLGLNSKTVLYGIGQDSPLV